MQNISMASIPECVFRLNCDGLFGRSSKERAARDASTAIEEVLFVDNEEVKSWLASMANDPFLLTMVAETFIAKDNHLLW